jgi:hypothetical protein
MCEAHDDTMCSGHGECQCPGHRECEDDGREGPGRRNVEAAVIDALVGEHGPWSLSELEREVGGMHPNPTETIDAIAHLYAGGLLHIQNDLITPTRAARRMHELLG